MSRKSKIVESSEPITIEILPAKTGPESKFNVDMCQQIIEIASQGGHIAAMMNRIGVVSKETWYAWQDKFPEFKQAVQGAKVVSQEFYERLGLMGMTGQIKDFNSTVYALTMNNKFKEDYSRGTGGNGTEVTIHNNTLNLTSEQVTQQIAQKLEKLQSLGIDLVNTGKE